MSFIKKREDFVCENCGHLVIGNGYTNHCCVCLFSKHVDIDPGDRLNTCGGLMEPVYVSYTNSGKYILHKCLRCGFEKKNLINENDSVEAMVAIQNKAGNKNR